MRKSVYLAIFLLVFIVLGFAYWFRSITTDPSEGRPADVPANHAVDAASEGDSSRKKQILGVEFGEFIFIQGGEFTMGRNEGEHEDQRPEHVVELSSFYVGRTPVTNAQFVEFLNETDVPSQDYPYSLVTHLIPSITLVDETWKASPGTEHDAIGGASWDLAQRYCEWLSDKSRRKYRLPTEAEWEYVCRGKEGRKFPWGNEEYYLVIKEDVKEEYDLVFRVWNWRTWQNMNPNTIPVGSFPKGATPEGVCDLVGYMDEMCSDWYDPNYYSKSPLKNPQGPEEPDFIHGDRNWDARVTRGGLEHRYSTEGIVGFFRVSKYLGVLPGIFLPRGWSRGHIDPHMNQGLALPNPPKNGGYGRLGFRIVVEFVKPGRPGSK